MPTPPGPPGADRGGGGPGARERRAAREGDGGAQATEDVDEEARGRRPSDGPKRVRGEEAARGHAGRAGDDRRDGPQTGDPSPEEHGLRAIPREERLAALEQVRPVSAEWAALRLKGTATGATTEPVPQVVPDDRRARGDADDERNAEAPLAREERGGDERRLPGDRQPRRLSRDETGEEAISEVRGNCDENGGVSLIAG